MFGLATGIYQSYFSPQQLNILLIGQENTGKTTLLERIKVTQTSRKAAARFKAIACPAPKKYKVESMKQDEEVVLPARQESQWSANDASSRSMEEIPLTSSRNEKRESFQEYNVKPGARMLPLDKIRPTSTYS
jgi:GTPase SAR1 family protein